jgi:hypothetical protein
VEGLLGGCLFTELVKIFFFRAQVGDQTGQPFLHEEHHGGTVGILVVLVAKQNLGHGFHEPPRALYRQEGDLEFALGFVDLVCGRSFRTGPLEREVWSSPGLACRVAKWQPASISRTPVLQRHIGAATRKASTVL